MLNKIICFIFIYLTATLFPNSENDFLRACLHGEFLQILTLYQEHGSQLINISDKSGNTPLHLACCLKKGGNKEPIINFLIDNGANINTYNADQSTPLTISVSNNNSPAVLRLLNEKNIQINKSFKKNFTPLHLASISEFPHIVKLLINHPKTNPNAITKEGSTPLHFTASQGLVEETQLLLNHPNITVNARQQDPIYSGATPLHLAAKEGCVDVVNLLLDHPNIDVNAVIDQGIHAGFTPLHFAVLHPDTTAVCEIIKSLIQRGAIRNINSQAGKKPKDLTNIPIVKKLLKSYKHKK